MSLPARIGWALELLAPMRGERVLEIGCGPGVAAAELVAAGCEVTALDRSAKAIEAAAARLGGRARLICGALQTADLPTAAFDAVLAINVNLFWTTDGAGLAALRRTLAPRGRLALVFDAPSETQAKRIGEALSANLAAAGLACDLRQGSGRQIAALARAYALGPRL
ncbi:MAG: class I SAM-dependent methyltransferase [Phenylobacterium sp.]|nr:class I SAM-dependent methyltransferase [Phenylobacterium sp.]